MNTNSPKLLPAREVRTRFGISNMTEWRWLKAGILPQPTQINGRKYYPEQAIIELAANGSPKGRKAAA